MFTSLLGLLTALSSVGFDSTAVLVNPYDVRCEDTCIVLPAPVFREATVRVVERNYYVREVSERQKLDSAQRQRIALDSVFAYMQTRQLESCDQSIKDMRKSVDANSWKQTARGFGYGVATAIGVYALLTVIGSF
jgi:hypothetical protein